MIVSADPAYASAATISTGAKPQWSCTQPLASDATAQPPDQSTLYQARGQAPLARRGLLHHQRIVKREARADAQPP